MLHLPLQCQGWSACAALLPHGMRRATTCHLTPDGMQVACCGLRRHCSRCARGPRCRCPAELLHTKHMSTCIALRGWISSRWALAGKRVLLAYVHSGPHLMKLCHTALQPGELYCDMFWLLLPKLTTRCCCLHQPEPVLLTWSCNSRIQLAHHQPAASFTCRMHGFEVCKHPASHRMDRASTRQHTVADSSTEPCLLTVQLHLTAWAQGQTMTGICNRQMAYL